MVRPSYCHFSDSVRNYVEKRLISYKLSETCENLSCEVYVFCRATYSYKYVGQACGILILTDLFILFLLTFNLKKLQRMCFGLLVINFGRTCAWKKGSSSLECITNYVRYILLPVQVFRMSVRKFNFYITVPRNW